jgi:hypothetical protein
MNLISGMLKVALSPIKAVTEVIDDVSGENSEAEQGLSILTLGASSIVKGVAKGIKDGAEDIF